MSNLAQLHATRNHYLEQAAAIEEQIAKLSDPNPEPHWYIYRVEATTVFHVSIKAVSKADADVAMRHWWDSDESSCLDPSDNGGPDWDYAFADTEDPDRYDASYYTNVSFAAADWLDQAEEEA